MTPSASLEKCFVAGDWWLVPRALHDGSNLRHDRALRLSGGQISHVGGAGEAGHDGAPVFRTPRIASPGFFDVQINGGGGVLFNANPTQEGLARIGAAHKATGTTSFL